MAGPTRGIAGVVLARWLDAVEDAGFDAVVHGDGQPVDYATHPWRS